MEKFKDVLGYEKKYKISNLGNVLSLPKLRCRKNKILKNQKTKNGYLQVDLGNGFDIKRYLVHKLVAEAFIENKENKAQVNHINGIKHDNRLENLEWCTSSENQKHSIDIGLRTTKGIKNSQSKLTEKQVLNIFKDTRPYKEIIKDYKISISTVSDIKRGYSWTHITGLNNMKNKIKW